MSYASIFARQDCPEVSNSVEFQRVVSLPRRNLDLANILDATVLFRHADGKMNFWPLQSAALIEASLAEGLFASLAVGGGKTLITLCLPDAMNSERAVLLVPAQLKWSLFNKMLPEYRRHFKLPPVFGYAVHDATFPPGLYVLSYSELSSHLKADALDRINPDLIIADECHSLRHRSSARTKRFLRFFREHPECRFAGLSGTVTNRSLMDYAHLLELALRKNAPIPLRYHEQLDWACAIDVKPQYPMEPGALFLLCQRGETIRSGFRRRLTETRGVVASVEGSLGTSLIIERVEAEVPKNVQSELDETRKNWTLGEEWFEDVITQHRALRQLSTGFYYKWNWPEGKKDYEWLEARKEWHSEVRGYLKHRASPGMDSPLLLAKAAKEGRWKAFFWEAWDKVRLRYRPTPAVETVWVNDFFVQDVVKRVRVSDTPCIVFYEPRALGQAIARAGNFALYDADRDPTTATENVIVASIGAHGTGKNLQRYSRLVVVSPPASGTIWEQMIGRIHRPGQEADEVVVEYYGHTFEMQKAVDQAIEDAKYIQETQGSKQKLLYATWVNHKPDTSM